MEVPSQATFVFFQSYLGEQMLALGGNTDNGFYNVSSRE
jgi:delta14-sterol reductase